MPTYKIEGQVVESTTGKKLLKAIVTLKVVINGQTIQETKAEVEQNGFFRMSFSNEFIPEGTKANFRVEDQNGNNLPTDFSLALRPSQEPVRVKIPVTVPGSDRYKIYVQVLNENGSNVENLKVECLHLQSQGVKLIQSAQTNTKGAVTFNFDSGVFEDQPSNTHPDLFFKVYSENELQYDGLESGDVHRNIKPGSHKFEIKIQSKPEKPEEEFRVSGIVYSSEDKPAAKVIVQVYDVDLRGAAIYDQVNSRQELEGSEGMELLGKTVTDADGYYEVVFEASDFSQNERDLADVMAYAFEEDEITGHSRLAFKKEYNEFNEIPDLDIQLQDEGDELSEFERIYPAAWDLAAETNLTLAAVSSSPAQISFMAEEIDFPASHIQILVTADQRIQEADNDSLFLSLMYALGRKDIPLTWSGITATPRSRLRQLLLQAMDENIIGSYDENTLASFLNVLEGVAAGFSLDQSPQDKPSIRDFLNLALPDENNAHTELMTAYTNHEGPISDFWDEVLPSLPAFQNNPEAIQNLRLTNSLSILTRHNLSIIRDLQNLNIRDPREIIYHPEEFDQIIQQHEVPGNIPGENEDVKKENYKRIMLRDLQATYPTDTVAFGIEQGDLQMREGLQEDMAAFFRSAIPEGFDLRKSDVADFENLFQDINPDRVAELQEETNKLKRILQVSPTPKAMSRLLNNNFNSINEIALIPKDIFQKKYGETLGEEETEIIHQRAVSINAYNEFALLNLHQLVHEPTFAMAGGSMNTIEGTEEAFLIEEAITGAIPEWRNLIGSLDYCECKHCRSMLSPAAYLVDLMHYYLNKGAEANEADEAKPLDVLLSRRPDIAHLELTCDNTNTIIPYVDLVNEILEFYVQHDIFTSVTAEDVHNTENVTPAELQASPQFHREKAYEKLSQAIYPFTLPYHQPLDAIRIYLDHLKSSRYELIDVLHPDKSAEITGALVMEYLGLNPLSYQIIIGEEITLPDETDPVTLPMFYGYDRDRADWKSSNSADEDTIPIVEDSILKIPELLNRTGIEYEDLISLLKTRFLNPHADQLLYLDQLFENSELTGNELYERLDQIQAGTLNPADDTGIMGSLEEAEIEPDEFQVWVEENFTDIRQVITLYEADAECNLENTELRTIERLYDPEGEEIPDGFFIRLHRFLRLWRKTGWSIRELDLVLKGLNTEALNADVLDKIYFIRKIQQVLNIPLAPLMSLWGTLDIHGPDSLYHKLFLNKAIQKIDDVFKPDKFGRYLDPESGTVLLNEHLPAILAAFRLEASDLERILEAASLGDASELNLQNLGIIYRHVVLARALKLKVEDLAVLLNIIGEDAATADLFHPFARWNGTENRFLNQDPHETWAFIELVDKIHDSGFNLQTLNYLIRNEEPEEERLSPSRQQFHGMLSALRDAFQTIEQDHPVLEDVNEDILGEKLSMLFEQPYVDQVIWLINNSLVFASHAPAGLSLTIPDTLADKLEYDSDTGTIRFSGIMSEDEKLELDALDTDPPYLSAIQDLFDQPQAILHDILYGVLEGSMVEAEELLLNRPPSTSDIETEEKYKFAHDHLLPYLKEKLRQDTLLINLVEVLDVDEVRLQNLLGSEVGTWKEFLADFGLSGSYSFSSGDESQLDENIDVEWDATNPEEVTWNGWIRIPANEPFTFILEVKQDTEQASLRVNHELLIENRAPGDPLLSSNRPASPLETGKLYPVQVTYRRNGAVDGGVKLSWKAPSHPKEVIPGVHLFPVMDAFHAEVLKWKRGSLLINGFGLNSEEIAYFKNNSADFEDLDLFNLSLPAWVRLYDYTYLTKRSLTDAVSLINLFSGAKREVLSISGVVSWLSESFNGNSDQFNRIIAEFGYDVSDFINEQALMNVYRSRQVINKLGIPVDAALQWGTIEEDFDNLHEVAQDIKRTVKDKYEEEVWLDVAPELSDLLRQNQKNALIQYLLVQQELKDWGVVDADGLFNYFLIDVQMDACMDTSRIKQAISSVQLFVHRCFLNLESRINNDEQEYGVNPESLSRSQWEWMKNYRVWEANRKVLIHAENWALPEFRIDKSAAYKGAESFLKQNDITSENSETAFRTYLHSLAEVAKLDICGMYEDEDRGEIHVFGRTSTRPYKYFYRKLVEKYKKWTPWEPVEIDIQGFEDNDNGGENNGVHLLPVVWKGRLFLFWPVFTIKTKSVLQGGADNSNRIKEIDEEISGKEANKEILEAIILGLPEEERGSLRYQVMILNNEINDLNREKRELQGGTNPSFIDIAEKPADSQKPETFWEVRMVYCEYKDGRWTSKKETNPALIKENNRFVIDPSKIYFQIVPGKELLIQKFDDLSDYGYDIEYNSCLYYFKLKSIHNQVEFERFDRGIASKLIKHRTNYLKQGSYSQLEKLHPQLLPFLNYSRKFNLLYPDNISSEEDSSYLKHQFFYQDLKKIYFVTPKPLYLVDTDFNQEDTLPIVDFRLTTTPNILNVNTGNNNIVNETSNGSETSGSNGLSIATKMHYDAPLAYVNSNDNSKQKITSAKLVFQTFFHPFVDEFIQKLNTESIFEMLKMNLERDSDIGETFNFNEEYYPTNLIKTPYPEEKVNFKMEGAYSLYNWELFFHLPLYIGSELSKNNRFEVAAKWFQSIFDPTTNESPTSEDYPEERFWKVRPFKQNLESIRNYLNNLGENDPLINEWRDHPFQPHIIARHLPNKYKKVAVMKTIDNYLAWGDHLFRQDTIESINEATQLYILASHILGDRPKGIPPRGIIRPQAYDSLKESLDDLSNAKVVLENRFPYSGEIPITGDETPSSLLGAGSVSYFCIPQNGKLLEYWNIVEDRLFKIRHCMNIEGVERQLALFQPPIDPGLLVQATARGLSLGSVLSDLNAPLSHYRFQFIFNKALEFCGEVKNIGASLLSALEKKDAEEIAKIRSTHELTMLNAIRQVREEQKNEAEQAEQSILKNRDAVVANFVHYQKLLGIEEPVEPDVGDEITELDVDVDVSLVDTGTTGVKLIPKELEELDKANQANNFRLTASTIESSANIASLFPNARIETKPFGVGASIEFGGRYIGTALSAIASHFNLLASHLNFESSQASRMASHIRREQEWTHQANQLIKEIKRIDSDLAGAQIRKDIATKELENHDKQIAQAEEVEQFLRNKFTNKELYSWMEGQLVHVYKQFYQLAYEMAKKAEKLYRFELGEKDTNFIRFGYFDSNKKGLLAGEQLNLALRQMERSYLEKNKRELEITKHLSLRQLNPMALLELKATGSTNISIPEWVFDLDCPGHYMRRIKTVAVSIPAVAGPYTSINCTLTLQKSTVRTSPSGEEYARDLKNEDPRFNDYLGVIQSIVTSSAQNDSGLFDVNLRDERFLPFENAGAVSTWRLELPAEIRQFDYDTITDLIIHIRYTARQGGTPLATKASSFIKENILSSANQSGFSILFSLKHDFPEDWHKFSTLEDEYFKTTISRDHFPYIAQIGDIKFGDTPFELWEINKENGRIEPVPLSAENISHSLDQLNSGDREGELEFLTALDKSSELFLLVNYNITF